MLNSVVQKQNNTTTSTNLDVLLIFFQTGPALQNDIPHPIFLRLIAQHGEMELQQLNQYIYRLSEKERSDKVHKNERRGKLLHCSLYTIIIAVTDAFFFFIATLGEILHVFLLFFS